MSQNLRSAAIGGLAATLVVAVSFAPRLGADRDEVTVRNSSSQAAGLDPDATTSAQEETTASTDEVDGTATTTSAPSTNDAKPVVTPTTTVTTAPPTSTTEPAPTTTTTVNLEPPVLTGLSVRPQYSYSHWSYSDAVQLTWNFLGAVNMNGGPSVEGVRIAYDDTSIKVPPNSPGGYTLAGLTPDRDYTFSVSAYNAAGEGPALSVSTRTFEDTAPVLSEIVKTGPGSFRVKAPNLHSVFIFLVVPGIDSTEHPPIPYCSAYTQAGENEAECVIDNLAPGHWQVHSVRIVDRTGRSTTYFGDGRLVEYGLAAGEATSVAGPYRQESFDFAPLEFEI
ncbi:MAG: fibronectin type III domain-containing protein [Acidimicrobiia bacterium]